MKKYIVLSKNNSFIMTINEDEKIKLSNSMKSKGWGEYTEIEDLGGVSIIKFNVQSRILKEEIGIPEYMDYREVNLLNRSKANKECEVFLIKTSNSEYCVFCPKSRLKEIIDMSSKDTLVLDSKGNKVYYFDL